MGSQKNTPLELSVILQTIESHLYVFVPEERIKYENLIKDIAELKTIMYPFVWTDMNSVDGLDYRKSIPIMADMIDYMSDFNIYNILHEWHFIENNSFESYEAVEKKLSDFLSFVKGNIDINELPIPHQSPQQLK